MNKRRILYLVTGLLVVIISGVAIYLNALLPIITGYAAKNLCSAVFISGREASKVEALELNFSFIRYTKNKVDYENKSVTSRFLWGHSKAIYREGFGSTLLRGTKEEDLKKIQFPSGISPTCMQDTIQWPLGDIIPDTATGIDLQAIKDITTKVIVDNAYNGNAFAFMVLHKGYPVSEAYKPDFDKNTRFLSWSMAKSFTNALIGILVRQDKIDIRQPADIEEWKGDERNKISINDLMQMQSGLEWNEDYGNRSDVTLMLHCESDMAHYAIGHQAFRPAGSLWYYSSGTTNIVSYLIRKQFIDDNKYYSFAHKELFNKTGMADAIFETDPAGTIIGSSYLYATARDYARFALLYQNDGIFNGERILPEGWVDYTVSEASASDGRYGSFFWLNRGRDLPSVPEDMYACQGHDGQRIFILPSQELIVIVLGYSPKSKGGMDFDSLLKDILSTLR